MALAVRAVRALFVYGFGPCSGVRCRSRDVAPAGDLLSFASPKESRQRKGDPAGCDPFASLRGDLRRDAVGVRRRTRCVHFVHCARTAAASQITKQLLPHAAQLPPRHRRVAGASRRDERDRAIASLGPRKNTKQGQGCAAALLTPVPRVPSVCAEERSGWRIRARDCLSEASSSETPPAASTAGCPVAKRRGRRQWGRLSFAYFSLARQRKVGRPPGRNPGPCTSTPSKA